MMGYRIKKKGVFVNNFMRSRILRLILTILLGLYIIPSKAQNYEVIFKVLDNKEAFNKIIGPGKLVADSVEVHNKSMAVISELWEEGYLTAAINNFSFTEDKALVQVTVGDPYSWIVLRKGNVPDQLLSKAGYNLNRIAGARFRYGKVASMMYEVIYQSQRSGLPFATIRLDSIRIEDNRIEASLNYNSGPFIRYDSLIVNGTYTKTGFLANYLSVHFDEPYNIRSLEAITSKIDRLPYLALLEEPVITFYEDRCRILLNVEEIKSNAIDGVIGFLPNEGRNERFLINGQADISLKNLFRSGKSLEMHWKSIREKTQSITIQYDHPVILGSPFNAGVAFDFLKEDTTYYIRTFNLGLSHIATQLHEFQFFANLKSARLLNVPQEEPSTVPDLLDFDLNSFGLTYNLRKVDHFDFPLNGFSMTLTGAIGLKHIRKNTAFDQLIYEQIDQNSNQINVVGKIELYKLIKSPFQLFLKLGSALIANEQLFINDAFRLGGLSTIRGFNENFFFSTRYILGNLEVRLLLQGGSMIYAFYDGAWIDLQTVQTSNTAYPFGTGLGTRLATGSGKLNLAFAVGKSDQRPLDIKFSKLHIGYITNF